MEYAQIITATQRQFTDEDRDIETRQAEVDTAQALLDRRRKALKRKRAGFEKMLAGWQTLDSEVVSGKPADEPGEAPEPAEGEAAA